MSQGKRKERNTTMAMVDELERGHEAKV